MLDTSNRKLLWRELAKRTMEPKVTMSPLAAFLRNLIKLVPRRAS